MRFTQSAAIAVVAILMPLGAKAGEGATVTTDALYSGKLAAGLEQLRPLAEAGDQEAAFGVGLIRFTATIESFAQALYRHGLAAPDPGPMLGRAMPLPVPANPDPAPLDYDTLRSILDAVVSNLDRATDELLAAGESGDYVMLVDPLQIRIDIDGDGIAEDAETLGGVIAVAAGMDEPRGRRPVRPPVDGRSGREQSTGASSGAPAEATAETTVGFDRADAIWLAGYSQVIAAQAEFLLAHDFSGLVNAAFHRLFPQAGLPMQDHAIGGMLMMDPASDTAIADAIAAIHMLNWPVVEPARLSNVRERFKTILALSRRNWDAILAETDDHRELVPSPRQTPIVPDGLVTDEVVSAWLETLDTAERILDGELLVPHWRFRQGFDLRAYFESATHTDLVMLLTGYDALPYLRDGPVASAESFAAANRVFGDQFLGYVFWFN